MYKSNKNDKIMSTPSMTGSRATTEPSNLTIESGHVGASNESFFLDLGEPKNQYTEQTMNLKPDRGKEKK